MTWEETCKKVSEHRKNAAPRYTSLDELEVKRVSQNLNTYMIWNKRVGLNVTSYCLSLLDRNDFLLGSKEVIEEVFIELKKIKQPNSILEDLRDIAYPEFVCENCIAMPEAGCYCEYNGAEAPGIGPSELILKLRTLLEKYDTGKLEDGNFLR